MIADTCIYNTQLNKTKLQTKKYQLIENANDCCKIVQEILMNEKIIALDCEGVFLSREGKLTLIQVLKSLKNLISIWFKAFKRLK